MDGVDCAYFVRHIRHKFMEVGKRLVDVDNVGPVAFSHRSRGASSGHSCSSDCLTNTIRNVITYGT